MQTNIENKMQTANTIKLPLVKYHFPDYGLVIEAVSLEEAQEKLLEIIKKNK